MAEEPDRDREADEPEVEPVQGFARAVPFRGGLFVRGAQEEGGLVVERAAGCRDRGGGHAVHERLAGAGHAAADAVPGFAGLPRTDGFGRGGGEEGEEGSGEEKEGEGLFHRSPPSTGRTTWTSIRHLSAEGSPKSTRSSETPRSWLEPR